MSAECCSVNVNILCKCIYLILNFECRHICGSGFQRLERRLWRRSTFEIVLSVSLGHLPAYERRTTVSAHEGESLSLLLVLLNILLEFSIFLKNIFVSLLLKISYWVHCKLSNYSISHLLGTHVSWKPYRWAPYQNHQVLCKFTVTQQLHANASINAFAAFLYA